MVYRLSLAALLFSLIHLHAFAQEVVYKSGGELTPELSATDVTFYGLNLRVDPFDSTVTGSVSLFLPTDSP